MTLAQRCHSRYYCNLSAMLLQPIGEFIPEVDVESVATSNFRLHVSKHMGSIAHKLMDCLIYRWGTHALPVGSSLPGLRIAILYAVFGLPKQEVHSRM